MYKDALKLVDSIWIPQDLSTPDTEFFWDRTVQPWRFLTEARQGAEAVTMRGLLGALGALPVVAATADQGVLTADVAALKAQVQHMTQLLAQLTQQGGAAAVTAQANADAASAAQQAGEALIRARADVSSQTPSLGAAGWNPSLTFNLGSAVGTNPVSNATFVNQPSSNDLELAQLLASKGVSGDQILQFLQSRGTGRTEHRSAWYQVMEGTSPLCVYTGMRGETRQSAQTKTINVQTQDGSNKLTMKHTIWPAARAEDVAIFTIRELSDDWKRGLAQGNQRMINITPPADRSLVPKIPVDVERFLEQINAALRVYDHASVLRAWEAAHHFVVDEFVSKRGQPTWDTVWMMPVFQAELKRTQRQAEGTFDVKKCCLNWNMRTGQKCNRDDPDPACTKLHLCMRCGANHRILDCPRD